MGRIYWFRMPETQAGLESALILKDEITASTFCFVYSSIKGRCRLEHCPNVNGSGGKARAAVAVAP